MNIQNLELLSADLTAQRDFYSRILELQTEPTGSRTC